MFVYTYSHNNHKLFFSYKKRTFENLFPSQKKKERWGKGFEASYPSLYTLQVQSPLPFKWIVFSYMQVASIYPCFLLTNCKFQYWQEQPLFLYIKNRLQGLKPSLDKRRTSCYIWPLPDSQAKIWSIQKKKTEEETWIPQIIIVFSFNI